MIAEVRQQSAQILQFPIKARIGVGRRGESGKPASTLGVQALPTVDCGSGWYHEAAILEAERAGRS